MKKKIAIISILAFVFAGALAFAANEVVEPNNYQEHIKLQDYVRTEMSLPQEEKTKKIIDKAKKYDFFQILRDKGYYEDEINDVMYKFLQIQSIYSISDEELKEIYKLVNKDYNLEKLIEIYEFTVYTDKFRDIKFVKELYDAAEKLKIQSTYWIEDAYDFVMKRQDYVLDERDVLRYVESGMSVEEIYAANVMSRQGNKNPKKLLDHKKSGKKWSEIAADTYTDLGEVEEENLSKIVSAVIKSKATGVEPSKIILDEQSADDLISTAMQAAQSAAGDLGISFSNVTEKVMDFAQEKLPGVDKTQIAKWLGDGHSIRLIEEMKKESNIDGIPLETKLEESEVQQ